MSNLRDTPEYQVLMIPSSESRPENSFAAGWHAGWKAGAATGVAQRIKDLLRANDVVPGYLRKQITKLCDEAIYGAEKHERNAQRTPLADRDGEGKSLPESAPRHAWD
jgi:hypothetical protein